MMRCEGYKNGYSRQKSVPILLISYFPKEYKPTMILSDDVHKDVIVGKILLIRLSN